MTEIVENLRKYRDDSLKPHTKQADYIYWRTADDYDFILHGLVYPLIKDVASRPEKGTLLDIGCGDGTFLLSCARQYRDALTWTGISAYPYHMLDWRLNRDASRLRELSHKGITINIGDIHTLYKQVPNDSVDIALAVFVFEYLANPWIGLKRVWNALKVGGVGAISRFPLHAHFPNPNDAEDIRKILKDRYNFTFGFHTVFFRKEVEQLNLPLGICEVQSEPSHNSGYRYPYYYVKNGSK